MKSTILFLFALILSVGTSAQGALGSIKGKVVDADNEYEPIPYARVWVEVAGSKQIVLCDSTGRFKIDPLNAGIYNLYAKSSGKDTFLITGVEVNRDKITHLEEIALTSTMNIIDVVWTEPLILKETGRIEIPLKDIAHSPYIRDPKALFTASNSDVKMVEGTSDLIIRGSRPNDVTYYIDGVKVYNLNGVPGCAIGGMMGYTGGIPARYGDTTGGVVALETKSYFDLYYQWKATKKQ